MYQPQPNRGNRFFAWIRSSLITRGRNRWIAGVCDGVARRLGWNATLVRALVILTSLLFGAGAGVLRIGLVPGYRTRRMAGSCARSWSTALGLELRGRAGMRRGGAVPAGAGWLAFGVAVLVFWLLVNRQSYAASWQPPQQGGSWPGQPAQPVQPGQPVRCAIAIYAAADVYEHGHHCKHARARGQPMPQPTCPVPSGYQQYARPVQSPYQTFQQPVNPPRRLHGQCAADLHRSADGGGAAVETRPPQASRTAAGTGDAWLGIAGDRRIWLVRHYDAG